MEIYLSMRTAGKYGGGLNGDLRHLDRLIQAELDKTGFRSSFDELWLTFSYPPMYVLPGLVGMEIDFDKYAETLPASRLDRKYKKIDITLKAPEFSENQEKAEQVNYQDKLDIEEKYKNISDADLAIVVVDKYLEAGNIIRSKLLNGDIYDFEIYKNTLLSIRSQITPEFIILMSIKQNAEVRAEKIQRSINLREQRKGERKPLNKKIRDFRVYDRLPKKTLYPYAYQYSEIFLNLLRRKGLMCPTYHHIYIGIDNSMEECLENFFAWDTWQQYGLSVIDTDNYLKQTEPDKDKSVFDVISAGLRDISDIDGLDPNIIDQTIEEIKIKGLDTELEFAVVENKSYKLTISYFSRSMEEKCPVYFTLLEKSTERTKKQQIGRADNSQLYVWLQKISINKTHIKVKSSNSIAADVWLKDMPRNMEFNINEILNG